MNNFLKGLVLVIILLVLVFGISQFYTRQAYEQQLEASYQRSFRELAVHVHNLEVELAKLQVTSWDTPNIDVVANILKLVYAAQANFGQLPLNGINLSRVENLLNQVQTQTLALIKTSLADTAAEKQQYVDLHTQVKYLNQELQQELYHWEKDANWVAWKSYFQTAVSRSIMIVPNEKFPLLQALVAIEEGMDQFIQPDIFDEFGDEEDDSGLNEPLVDEDILMVAREFLGEMAYGKDFRIANQSSGDLGTSTIYVTAVNSPTIVLEIENRSGNILWMTNDRVVTSSQLNQDQLINIAQEFLSSRGFAPLESISSDHFDNRLMATFVAIEEGTLIYPRQVKVQIAEDNGEIMGFHGSSYYNSLAVQNFQPIITVDQAKASLKESNEVIDQRLSLITDRNSNEILSYQFQVKNNGDQYLIYLNAMTGAEEIIVPHPSRIFP